MSPLTLKTRLPLTAPAHFATPTATTNREVARIDLERHLWVDICDFTDPGVTISRTPGGDFTDPGGRLHEG